MPFPQGLFGAGSPLRTGLQQAASGLNNWMRTEDTRGFTGADRLNMVAGALRETNPAWQGAYADAQQQALLGYRQRQTDGDDPEELQRRMQAWLASQGYPNSAAGGGFGQGAGYPPPGHGGVIPGTPATGQAWPTPYPPSGLGKGAGYGPR